MFPLDIEFEHSVYMGVPSIFLHACAEGNYL